MKKFFLWSGLALLLLIIWANFRVWYVSKNQIYSTLEEVPKFRTGVLLGTSAKMNNGRDNLFFTTRINAAVALFESGKIQEILISGDNGTKDYNEPEDMMNELNAKGIPRKNIHLDYAGFDTYDSMIRANKVFKQNNFLVISQKFHVQRAVYIARKLGINASGFAAEDVRKMGGFKTKLREVFARVKAFKDVLLKVEPTYLGKDEGF